MNRRVFSYQVLEVKEYYQDLRLFRLPPQLLHPHKLIAGHLIPLYRRIGMLVTMRKLLFYFWFTPPNKRKKIELNHGLYFRCPSSHHNSRNNSPASRSNGSAPNSSIGRRGSSETRPGGSIGSLHSRSRERSG